MQNIDYILDRLIEGVAPEVIEQIVCLIKADEIRKGIQKDKPKTKEKAPALYIYDRCISLSVSATKLAPLRDGNIYADVEIEGCRLKITPTKEITSYLPAQTRLRHNGILTIYNKRLVQSIRVLFDLPGKRIVCPVEFDGQSWIADLKTYVCEE